MVKLTLNFENIKEKIPSSQRKRLYRYAKTAHKFILCTQEDIDAKNWTTTHEVVGLNFPESLNIVSNLILELSANYPEDPEFKNKMRRYLDSILETVESVRAKRTGTYHMLKHTLIPADRR